jgi:hypothetical protein
MAIPVSSGKAPGKPMSPGMHAAVVTEVRDLGEQPDSYNPGKTRRTVLAVYKNAAGEEAARFYNPTMHEKAKLGKDVRAITGGAVPATFKDMGDTWPAGLIGMQCQLLVTNKQNTKGYTNADITAVLPPAAGQSVTPAAPAPAAVVVNGEEPPF